MQRAWFAGFAVVFVLRLLAEARVKPRDTESRPLQRGKVSLQLLSLPFLVSAFATGLLLWRDGGSNPVFYGAGLILFAVGFAGRASALRKLGRSYSLYIDPAPTEALRTVGIYGRIRHPVYAFYLLETLSLSIIRPNIVSLVSLVLVALATAWRIHEEECALLDRYGEEYREYMKRTNRLLPWIY
ncbi:MAG: isoprenylcysteine carboxylmethyltransferase family protein [Verrucomicrobiota bacterium]|jgi:protein-S-isoprenylcysteine O-methyltransferase Ste14